jgi:hypothetical protein
MVLPSSAPRLARGVAPMRASTRQVSEMAGILKFFGSIVGIIFLIGLLVVIGLLALIF